MLSNGVKRRFDTFIDAILAIIITIMALELPSTLDGDVGEKLGEFLAAVLIYGISFSFISSIWYQLTRTFDGITQMPKKTMILQLVMLFFASLVPSLTKMMVYNPTNIKVTTYGMVLMMTEFIMQYISYATISMRYPDTQDFEKLYKRIYQTFAAETALQGVGLIILGCFLPRIALIGYLIMPVRNFLTVDINQLEVQMLNRIPDDYRETFITLSMRQRRQLRKAIRRCRADTTRLSHPGAKARQVDLQRVNHDVAKILTLPEHIVSAWFAEPKLQNENETQSKKT